MVAYQLLKKSVPMLYIKLHESSPNRRDVRRLVDILKKDGVIACPTDSSYALICALDAKAPVERIRKLRHLDKKHHFSLFCRDFSHLSQYAVVNNQQFRWLKAHLPGPYTAILPATSSVPRRLMHKSRQTIGLRIPNHGVLQALLEEMGDALMGVSFIIPGALWPVYDVSDVQPKFLNLLDAVVESTVPSTEPTSVIDLTEDYPEIIRQGQGDDLLNL